MQDFAIGVLGTLSVWCFWSIYQNRRRDVLNEGPRYNHAAKASADIINLYLNSDDPAPVKFAKILYRIKDAMDKAESELAEMRDIVSRN